MSLHTVVQGFIPYYNLSIHCGMDMTTLSFLEFGDLTQIPTLTCTCEFSSASTSCLEVRLSPGADCKMTRCPTKLGAEYKQSVESCIVPNDNGAGHEFLFWIHEAVRWLYSDFLIS